VTLPSPDSRFDSLYLSNYATINIRDELSRLPGVGNVTVFGQSGGGAKIATLMAMPEADGLFHRAMTMSGQQVTAAGPRAAAQRTALFLAELGLGPRDTDALALPA